MATCRSADEEYQTEATARERMPKSRRKENKVSTMVDEGVKYHSTRSSSRCHVYMSCLLGLRCVCVLVLESRPQIRLCRRTMTRHKEKDLYLGEKNVKWSQKSERIAPFFSCLLCIFSRGEEFQMALLKVFVSHVTFWEGFIC